MCMMDKREIILQMDSQEYDALRRALLAYDTDPRAEMQKRLDACYQELVPAQERKQIADPIHKASALNTDVHQDIAIFRVVEDGACRCFWMDDPSVDAMEIAKHLQHYLSDGKKGGFASLFERRTPIPEQKYIDHVMDALCDYEETTSVFHVDLDRGTFSLLDPENGWWSYPLLAAANSAHLVPEDMDVGREQRNAYFRQVLDGKRIDTDERCLLLCGDRSLRVSDFEIKEYTNTENGIATFELDLCTDMETVFGSRIAKDEDSYAVVYASYDISKGTVLGNLDIGLLRDIGSEYFVYPIDTELADAVKRKMDDYCMEEYEMDLADWAAQEQGLPSQFREYLT